MAGNTLRLQIIGDTIELDGQTVALIMDDARRSGPVADFLDWIGEIDQVGGEVEEPEEKPATDKPPKPVDYDIALDDVLRVSKEYARGGLLRTSDLARIVTSLKEG